MDDNFKIGLSVTPASRAGMHALWIGVGRSVGEAIEFQLNYSALVRAMTSPFVDKVVRSYPSTTWTSCSRASSTNGTSASPESWVPSRLTRDTPRQTPLGFSTVIR